MNSNATALVMLDFDGVIDSWNFYVGVLNNV